MNGPVNLAAVVAWKAVYGALPDDYVVVDVETTGLEPTDVILQVGWCDVANRQATLNDALVVNWPAVMTHTDRHELAQRLERTREKMNDKGKAYPWTVEMLEGRGSPPETVAARLVQLFSNDRSYVGHFAWRFDYARIGRFMARYANGSFAPPVAKMIDTALLVKACQTDLRPYATEDPGAFWTRVADARPNGKFSLETCVGLFALAQKGAAVKSAHISDYDAWITHLLLEAIRERTN